MIGQGENVNPPRSGVLNQLCRREETVRNSGMAMQIDVEHEGG